MSLTHAGIGGSGLQPFNIPAPIPKHIPTGGSGSGGGGCNDGCCGPNLNKNMLTPSSSRFRGELSGSQCLSVQIGEDKMCGAIWSESDFTTTTLKEAMSAAISVNQEGNVGILNFLTSPSVKTFNEIKGVCYGSSAEAKINKSDNTDVLFPCYHVGQEVSQDVDIMTLLSDPTSSFSKTQAYQLSLTKSSTDEVIKLHPEELIALQLQYWSSRAHVHKQDDKKSIDTRKKKKLKHEKGITLVVPGYYGQRERHVMKTSTRLAGLELQHIYSRGLCSAAASLFGQKSSQVHNILQSWTNKNSSKNPLIMFVHVSGHGVEVSLISCEQPLEKVKKDVASNMMHYDRLVCLASGGVGCALDGVSGGSVDKQKDKSNSSCYSKSVMDLVSDVINEQLNVANVKADDISLVLHSGQGSTKSLHETFSLRDDLIDIQSVPLLPVPEDDAARGGSILTAAELDSSKQYIDLDEENSVLVHCLSIAEDVMSTSAGVLYVESSEMLESLSLGNDEKVQESIQYLYREGTIVRKADVGPVRQEIRTPVVDAKEFTDGSVNFFGSHVPTYTDPSFPRLLLLQHETVLTKNDDGDYTPRKVWRPVTDVGFPLLTDNGKHLLKTMRKCSKEGKEIDKASQQKNALVSCKINFKMNESHGLLTLEHAQGKKVTELIKSKSQRAKIFYVIGFIILLIVMYYSYGVYVKQEEYNQDKMWLSEFYEKHAPHKLDDPNMLDDTLERYKGKMFVLWRKLEKTYDVKVPPPERILDSNYEF